MAGFDSNVGKSNLGEWSSLPIGARLTIVKLAPDGSEAARYPGEVAQPLDEAGWIVIHATWAHRNLDLNGLEFRAGDHLLEWFSPTQPVNAFAVLTEDGTLKGWYANVTEPTRLDMSIDPPLLIWHDLFVDLVGLPDKSMVIRDDDELAASGLSQSNRLLHERILRARSELIRRFEAELPPFVAASQLEKILAVWERHTAAF